MVTSSVLFSDVRFVLFSVTFILTKEEAPYTSLGLHYGPVAPPTLLLETSSTHMECTWSGALTAGTGRPLDVHWRFLAERAPSCWGAEAAEARRERLLTGSVPQRGVEHTGLHPLKDNAMLDPTGLRITCDDGSERWPPPHTLKGPAGSDAALGPFTTGLTTTITPAASARPGPRFPAVAPPESRSQSQSVLQGLMGACSGSCASLLHHLLFSPRGPWGIVTILFITVLRRGHTQGCLEAACACMHTNIQGLGVGGEEDASMNSGQESESSV
ncbi:unnamed protein product [Gadus morhua 'NCC']